MAEHTERLKANDSLKLSQEYEVSPPSASHPHHLGLTGTYPDTHALPFLSSPSTLDSSSHGNIPTWK